MRQLPHPDCASRQVTAARSPAWARQRLLLTHTSRGFRVCGVRRLALPGLRLLVAGLVVLCGRCDAVAVLVGGRRKGAVGWGASWRLRRGRGPGFLVGGLSAEGCVAWRLLAPCSRSHAVGGRREPRHPAQPHQQVRCLLLQLEALLASISRHHCRLQGDWRLAPPFAQPRRWHRCERVPPRCRLMQVAGVVASIDPILAPQCDTPSCAPLRTRAGRGLFGDLCRDWG